MKFSKVPGSWGAVFGLLVAAVFFTGCHTVPPAEAANMSSAAPAAGSNPADEDSYVLKIGDSLHVEFQDLPSTVAPFDVKILEDGSINLLLNEKFVAAGKKVGELQKEIRDRYVPSQFRHMTVTIRLLDQWYYVGGEVKSPGRFNYVGRITITRAIQSAGDFTEFANKKKVDLFRGKKTFRLNCLKILKDPSLDMEVLPGDRIHVYRRLW
jgi:polysaccharide export outer membrane protein